MAAAHAFALHLNDTPTYSPTSSPFDSSVPSGLVSLSSTASPWVATLLNAAHDVFVNTQASVTVCQRKRRRTTSDAPRGVVSPAVLQRHLHPVLTAASKRYRAIAREAAAAAHAEVAVALSGADLQDGMSSDAAAAREQLVSAAELEGEALSLTHTIMHAAEVAFVCDPSTATLAYFEWIRENWMQLADDALVRHAMHTATVTECWA